MVCLVSVVYIKHKISLQIDNVTCASRKITLPVLPWFKKGCEYVPQTNLTSDNSSVASEFVNTLLLTVLAQLISLPLVDAKMFCKEWSDSSSLVKLSEWL